MGIEMKTIGELIDEATKSEIRHDKAGTDYDLALGDFIVLSFPGRVTPDKVLEVCKAWRDLVAVNREIWELIDEVTGFDMTQAHEPVEFWHIVGAAQNVQSANRTRTNIIRKINELAGETRNIPAKIHKGVV